MYGIDIASVDDNVVDWSAVKDGGRTFAIVRATWGRTPDDAFAASWRGMRDARMLRGAYHFLRYTQPAEDQANEFLDVVEAAGGFEPGDFPPVLDVEESPGFTATTALESAQAWLAVVEPALRAMLGHDLRPMIYTSKRVWALLDDPTGFAQYPLWTADYGRYVDPRVPPEWGDGEWTLHQYAGDTKNVPGVSRQADLDKFNLLHLGSSGGRVLALKELLAAQGLTPPPGPDFDEPTADVVRAFQLRRGLAIDGIVGPKTWSQALWP